MSSPTPQIDPVVMMQFLLITQFLMGIWHLWNQRTAQKRSVAMVEEFATRKELQALAEKVEDKFDRLLGELAADKNEIVKAGEQRVVKLHDRINEVLSAVSELRGEVHASRGRTGI